MGSRPIQMYLLQQSFEEICGFNSLREDISFSGYPRSLTSRARRIPCCEGVHVRRVRYLRTSGEIRVQPSTSLISIMSCDKEQYVH